MDTKAFSFSDPASSSLSPCFFLRRKKKIRPAIRPTPKMTPIAIPAFAPSEIPPELAATADGEAVDLSNEEELVAAAFSRPVPDKEDLEDVEVDNVVWTAVVLSC